MKTVKELELSLIVKEAMIQQLKYKIELLNNIIEDSIDYIKWHYDLGTEDNVEFCILRDRLLDILKKKKKELIKSASRRLCKN